MPRVCVMTPLGPLILLEKSAAIVSLDWGRASDAEPSPLLIEAKNQLEAYFHGRLKVFDLPLAPPGTAFRRSWNASPMAKPGPMGKWPWI